MASKKKADDSHSNQPKTAKPRSKPAAGKAVRSPRGALSPATSAAADSGPTAAAPGKVVVERVIGGRTLSLETGRMAKLSDGAVVARYGDTMVLATVNSAKAPEGIDFFPLTVDYREKTSAAGVIPGGFFKREGRPSTKEILACRIIDRSIRPMFPDGFKREVQVLSQVLSTDRENDPDVLAAIASFAALAVSSLPHGRSLGMVRIGCVDDKLTVNPLWTEIQSEANKLNLTVAGHHDGIAMVEAGAKEVGEELMLQALELAHENCREIAGMIDELTAKAGKPKMAFTPPQQDPELVRAIEDEFGADLRSAPLTPGSKQTRGAATKAAKEKAAKKFHAPTGASADEQKVWNTKVAEILGDIVKDAERQSILKGRRADGRDHTTVRPITIEVGVLPRVHGSVLFTRGETQALGVVTLGGTDDQQIIDGLMPEGRKRFLLHYNFPPFSVGEVKRVGTPGRREIGHGALAERGLEAVLPSREEFPYTIRITSEILESNGSSSMATACSGTLAMMDAGVPIKQPVAGIAMGLVMEGKKYAILTDILGSEDACGDMDFKVVGTGRGITALQMDIKCDGLTRQIMAEALEQAKQGRLHVLREMLKVMRAPREQLSPNAPRLESLQVPNEKIGLIIGPGGKNIRAMQENFECKISIEDGGLCTITGVNAEKVKAAVAHIKAMTAEVEFGGIYEGRVTAIKEFGAFVEILPGQEGLVHVSELSDGFIRAVTDVVRIGDTLKVKVIAIDDFGKVKLSRKAILLAEKGSAVAPPAGEPSSPPAEPVRPDFAERGPRGDRPERAERPERQERPDRGGRFDRGPRPEWSERGERGDRPERGPRPERGDRPDRGDRPEREERSFRPEREDRPFRPERMDRPHREDRGGGRDERGPREDRPVRDERGPREDRPVRDERGPREDRPVRDERGPREDRPLRDERGPREDRPVRDERGPREDRPLRDERGPREDRPVRDERGPREDRPVRDERGPREDRPVRDERGPREDRPVRGDRPYREDRPFRQERHDRSHRDERTARDAGPLGGQRLDRPARAPRDAEDRGEGSPVRGGSERPLRGERTSPGEARGDRMEGGGSTPGADRFGRRSPGDRPEHERLDRPAPRFPRPEHGASEGEGVVGSGARSRRDEPRQDASRREVPRREDPRGGEGFERRPVREAASGREPAVPGLGGPVGGGRVPPRGDRPDRPERGDRADRSARGDRPDRGASERAPRTVLPMVDFDEGPERPVKPADEVGQLESLDSVLGTDPRGPDARRDRRRRRD